MKRSQTKPAIFDRYAFIFLPLAIIALLWIIAPVSLLISGISPTQLYITNGVTENVVLLAAPVTPLFNSIINEVPCPLSACTVQEIISELSNCLFPVVGLVLFAMILYGGIVKLTAAGSPEREKKAMKILRNAIIGTAIIVLARVIVNTVSAILGMPTL